MAHGVAIAQIISTFFDTKFSAMVLAVPVSVWALSYILIIRFNELIDEYPNFRSYIPKVTDEVVREVLNRLNMRVKSQIIVDWVMKRYNMITN